MKKILLSLAASSLFPAGFAQQKHEIGLGAGTLSRPYVRDGLHIKQSYGGLGDDNSYSGTYNIAYLYRFSSRFASGLTFIYESQKHDKTASSTGPAYWGLHNIYKERFFTMAATFRTYWVHKKIFSLYSHVAAGVSIKSHEEKRNDFGGYDNTPKNRFAYQITPVGIRIGTHIGGFAELGYGYQGMICAGVSYRF
jgi:hypothetical protein